MNELNTVLKTICISGNLKDSIIFNLCPTYINIQEGVWKISISDVAISNTSTQANILCGIKCNLVSNHEISNEGITFISYPILAYIELNGKTNQKSIARLQPKWFTVSDKNLRIKLSFENLILKTPVISSSLVFVNILFVKVA